MNATQAASSRAATAPCEGTSGDAACGWLLEGGPRPEVDAALLEAIFADPELADARQRGGGALRQLGRMLREWLASLLESSGAAGFAEWTRSLILLAAVLLLGALALRWVRRQRPGRPAPAAPGVAPAPMEVLDLPSRHLARGREALTAAPREAIRQGLLALLSGLEGAGVIPRGRVRTNRELAQALASSGAVGEEVGLLTGLLAWYDRAFYSLAPVTPEEAEDFLGRIEARLSVLERLEAAA